MRLVRTGGCGLGRLLNFLNRLAPIALENVVDGRRRTTVTAGDGTQ